VLNTAPAGLILHGRFRISEVGQPRRTRGKFADWIAGNRTTLRHYFGVDLFAGSLNVDIDDGPADLHESLDRGHPTPAFVIPRGELTLMARYLGDGRAWRATLTAARLSDSHSCWVFRRARSQVPPNVLELVSALPLVETFGLRNGEEMALIICAGPSA
jgi:CTP-dependent riboflavin kinase